MVCPGQNDSFSSLLSRQDKGAISEASSYTHSYRSSFGDILKINTANKRKILWGKDLLYALKSSECYLELGVMKPTFIKGLQNAPRAGTL